MVDCKLFNTDEDAVRDLLRHPHASIALSDAGAHLSFLCDAGFGLHLFGHWVRERGDLTLEQAVQSVTSRPADIYRIQDRGRLAVGAWADMILFDPATRGTRRKAARVGSARRREPRRYACRRPARRVGQRHAHGKRKGGDRRLRPAREVVAGVFCLETKSSAQRRKGVQEGIGANTRTYLRIPRVRDGAYLGAVLDQIFHEDALEIHRRLVPRRLAANRAEYTL